MKTKIFIDFDGTLFDRDIFKVKLVEFLKRQGYTVAEVELGYRAVYQNNGYAGALAHLEYLHQNIRPTDIERAKADLDQLFHFAKTLLFPGAIKFLEGINRQVYEVNLITVGGIEFQKQKVEACQISKFFDNCYYITEEKADTLMDLVDKDEYFILLEDKDDTIISVRERFPKSVVLKAEKGKLPEQLRVINSSLIDKIYAGATRSRNN